MRRRFGNITLVQNTVKSKRLASCIRLKSLVALCAAVVCCCEVALADTVLRAWGRPKMRSDVIALIAAAAKSEPATIPEGASIRKLVDAKCGHVDPAYLTELRKRNPRHAENLKNIDAPAASSSLELPACLYSTTSSFRYTLQERETFTEIAKRFTGFAGSKTRQQFQKVNPGRNPIRAKAGDTIVVPYKAKATDLRFATLEESEGFQAQLSRLDEYYSPGAPPHPAKAGAPLLFNTPVNANVGLCTSLPIKLNDIQCDAASPNYPINIQELTNVLKLLKWIREAKGASTTPGVVVIVDTGLTGFENADFTAGTGLPDTFYVEELNVYPLEGGAKTVGQSFSYSLNVNPHRPSPIVDPSYFWPHGTYIAGILAGALQAPALRAETKSHVQLSALNTVGKDPEEPICNRFSVRPGFVYQAVAKAGVMAPKKTRKVVNMSISYDQTLEIRELISDSSNLFVVSAGNREIDLDQTPVLYPAAYGSSGLQNLIVVAAHDARGLRVPGTAQGGKRTVDLAAPGCKIKSLTGAQSSQVGSYSGTSAAAAFVSFAAALLSGSYADLAASTVRNRILLTVDRTDGLQGVAKTGGQLNIAKAVAADLDIMQTVDGAAVKTRYGVFDDTSDQIQLCDTVNPDHRKALTDIGRVDFKSLGGQSRNVTVLSETRDVLLNDTCSVANRTVSFREYSSPGHLGPSRSIKLSDVVQIIPTSSFGDRRWQRLHVPKDAN
jgi:hypothetical protein